MKRLRKSLTQFRTTRCQRNTDAAMKRIAGVSGDRTQKVAGLFLRETMRIFLLSVLLASIARTSLGQVNVSIGTLAPGESVTITYDVTIDNPLSPSVTQISSQGTVSGSNFTSVNTDDPETTSANDATVTTLQDDAPVVTSGNTIAYTEQAAATVISSALTVTDVDSLSLAGATVTISSGFV